MIKKFEEHNLISWAITILIAGIIFYVSTLIIEEKATIFNTSLPSMIYHILIFFFLSLFLFISLIQGKRNRKLFLFGSLIALAYGIIDEIHQFFVPGRFSTFEDVIFDFIGISLAFMIYSISLIFRKNN